MTDLSCTEKNERLTLKEPTGWFAASDGFRKALTSLSDGAFRLFAFLCLEADRHTGRHEATQRELAGALGKSKRIIGSYVAELEAKGICTVRPGKNQFARTVFEITDRYWPYHRREETQELPKQDAYVASVREYFLALGCANGKFGIADERVARQMQERGIPLVVIQDTMLMGACRKYSSWFEGRALEPIQSLRYFDELIAEIQHKPFPPGYSGYLRKKIKQFAELWKESLKSGKQAVEGGCRGMPSQGMVQ